MFESFKDGQKEYLIDTSINPLLQLGFQFHNRRHIEWKKITKDFQWKFG